MFGRSEKIWKQYPQNIVAINNHEALYLSHYISYVRMSKCYLSLIEIIDLQHYRLIQKKHMIQRMLSHSCDEQLFLFPFNKN